MKTQPKRRVVLAFPISLAFIERQLQGIADYARRAGPWNLTRMPEIQSTSLGWLRHWHGDGAIVLVTTPEDAQIARGLPFPVVNMAGHLAHPGVPTVMVDHKAIGRVAAEHLLERRFRHFGYYGTSGKWYSNQRRAGFVETVRQARGSCAVLQAANLPGARTRWTDQQEELERWLSALPTPVGIMASNDPRAGMVLDACLALGRRVPEEVAIVGVDNDPVACEYCAVPLSSVARKDREVGERAAALLDDLMRGERAPAKAILLPPAGVVLRSSTDTLAIDDPHVAAAHGYIQAHLSEPFGVERVLEASQLSRRRLEQRFRECLGKTPYAFISEQRVEHAKRLLAQRASLRLTRIAVACGFSDLRHFRLVFRRLAGTTPAQYRRALLQTNASEASCRKGER